MSALGFLIARRFAPGRVTIYDPIPLTSYPGIESNPALSPDGKLIAFTWSGPSYGEVQVYVKQLDASEPLAITRAEAGAHVWPTWSPDGRQVALVRFHSGGRSLIIAPALGGPERQVARLDEVAGPGLGWLPVANAVVVGGAADRGLLAVSLASGEGKRLTEPPTGWVDGFPKLSPDGSTLAFARDARIAGSSSEIYVLRLNSRQEPDGPPKLIPAAVQDVRGLDWAPDGRSLVVSSLRNGASRLNRISVPGGAMEMFPGAPAGAGEVSICASARRMAITVEQHDIDLWRLAGPRWPASQDPPEPERLVASTYEDVSPNYSPDGKRIVFESSRTGSQEIWAVDTDGRNAVQLTNFGGPSVGTPRWSPDGTKIAFDSRKFGSSDLFVVSANGGAPARLTSEPSNDTRPTWSSDGRSIFFLSDRTGGREVWKIPAEGGPATQLTKDGAADVQRIAGDTFLYYQRGVSIYRMPEAGGTVEKVSPAAPGSRWVPSPDGVLMYEVGGSSTLALFRFGESRGSVVRQLPQPASPRFLRTGTFTVSPDGRWVVLPLTAVDRMDLMLIENLR